jgi:hypothetical protein
MIQDESGLKRTVREEGVFPSTTQSFSRFPIQTCTDLIRINQIGSFAGYSSGLWMATGLDQSYSVG